jgi:hypothetical protein
MDDNENEVVSNVQHLVWLQTLLDDLYECDDLDNLTRYLDHANSYFNRLNDDEKSDLFIYALGFIRREQIASESESE